jgi:hypothetical protein
VSDRQVAPACPYAISVLSEFARGESRMRRAALTRTPRHMTSRVIGDRPSHSRPARPVSVNGSAIRPTGAAEKDADAVPRGRQPCTDAKPHDRRRLIDGAGDRRCRRESCLRDVRRQHPRRQDPPELRLRGGEPSPVRRHDEHRARTDRRLRAGTRYDQNIVWWPQRDHDVATVPYTVLAEGPLGPSSWTGVLTISIGGYAQDVRTCPAQGRTHCPWVRTRSRWCCTEATGRRRRPGPSRSTDGRGGPVHLISDS